MNLVVNVIDTVISCRSKNKLFIALPSNRMKELSQDKHFVLHNCSQFNSVQSLHISRTVEPTHNSNVSQSPL